VETTTWRRHGLSWTSLLRAISYNEPTTTTTTTTTMIVILSSTLQIFGAARLAVDMDIYG